MRTMIPFISMTLVACVTTQARAEIDWSYLGSKEITITSGASSLTFLGTLGAAANNSGVVLYNISATSATLGSDRFDKVPFTLTVSIVDELARSTKTGNELGSLTLEGTFTADLGKRSLTNWSVEWESGEGELVLGNDVVGRRRYDVKVDGFLPPSPNNPTVNGRGSVYASVTVAPIDGAGSPPSETPETPETPAPPGASESPEPGTLLMAGLGVGSLVLYRKRMSLRREPIVA